jgi:hypothetical protein
MFTIAEAPAGRDAEGRGKLTQYRIAVVKVSPDHQAGEAELTGDEPAVIPPLHQAIGQGAPHAWQGAGTVAYLIGFHARCP